MERSEILSEAKCFVNKIGRAASDIAFQSLSIGCRYAMLRNYTFTVALFDDLHKGFAKQNLDRRYKICPSASIT